MNPGLAFARIFAGRRGAGIHASLADYRQYERQIDRLHQRHLFDGGLHQLTDGEVSLATVVMHRGHVARLLARTVGRGEYQLRPATIRPIIVDGKPRTVFEYPLLDLIVHGVVADVLSQAIEPTLTNDVYSYRPGRSSADAVSGFARYLREHRRARPDPTTRGLYVLRRDVDSYTDSIPLDARSPIWTLLHDAMAAFGAPAATGADLQLVDAVIRPTVLTNDGWPATRLRGVATGQPISCVCFNVFLRDIDREITDVPGAFYARYSDDLVFAHPDAQVTRDVSDMLDARIGALGLIFNIEKRRDVYLTGAGRASVDWPAARGTTSVPFLGMRVSLDGTVALGRRKGRGFIRDARRRAGNTAQALAGADEESRGRAIARTLNALLNPDDPQLHGSAAPLLARLVTDRRQLDELDHLLARICASTATGVSMRAAFRMIPYRRVRRDWGLVSLRRARDRGRFGGGSRR